EKTATNLFIFSYIKTFCNNSKIFKRMFIAKFKRKLKDVEKIPTLNNEKEKEKKRDFNPNVIVKDVFYVFRLSSNVHCAYWLCVRIDNSTFDNDRFICPGSFDKTIYKKYDGLIVIICGHIKNKDILATSDGKYLLIDKIKEFLSFGVSENIIEKNQIIFNHKVKTDNLLFILIVNLFKYILKIIKKKLGKFHNYKTKNKIIFNKYLIVILQNLFHLLYFMIILSLNIKDIKFLFQTSNKKNIFNLFKKKLNNFIKSQKGVRCLNVVDYIKK
ncbi:hypothetical protein RFI_14541, partial [Reticulomyxa filosa]